MDGIGSTPIARKHIAEVQLTSTHQTRSSTTSVDSSPVHDISSVYVVCYAVEHSLTVNTGIDANSIRKVMTDSQLTPWADPNFGRPSRIDVLCGKDANRTYSGSDFYSSGRELLFVQTCFGWTVGGGLPATSQPHSVAISRASADV